MSGMKKSQRDLISAVIVVTFVALAIIPATRRVSANTFTVTNTSDCAGVGCGSLRRAISDANAASGGTITFAAGVSGTIDLLLPLDNLNSDITIIGPGASVLTVERSSAVGTPDCRVFTIDSGKTVSINGLTIKDGNLIGMSGGGIASFGTLTISNCAVANNAGNSGGGIWNAGMVTINNCTVADNS